MNCRVMGIVNVTPDSFSDGGRFFSPEEALRRARNIVAEGAAFIDVGGESTRPGATPIGWEEEWDRIAPVLRALVSPDFARGKSLAVSVDTYHPETAERAIAAGVRIVNCVRADAAREMLRTFRDRDVSWVVPATLLDACPTETSACAERLWIDPMIGFGTTRDEDLALLRSVPDLARRGRVLVGASRKRIVKKLTGSTVTGKDLGGCLAIALWCAIHGADVVRVHDVRETVQALRAYGALG